MQRTKGISLKDLASKIDKAVSFLPAKLGIQVSEEWKILLLADGKFLSAASLSDYFLPWVTILLIFAVSSLYWIKYSGALPFNRYISKF